MQKYLLPALFFVLTQTGFSQNISDALRYSILSTGSTARTLGVGGSLNALGGDFSVLSTNPAGLAVFRRSDFILSTAVYNNNTSSELINSNYPAYIRNASNFSLDAVGLVVSTRPQSQNWRIFNFAIGLNRVANYHQDFRYEGAVPTSISNRFAELANGLNPDELDEFEAGPAYSVYAIEEAPPFSKNYYSYINDSLLTGKNISDIYRYQRLQANGSMNEMVLSFAGNFDDRLSIGATIGIPFINYEERINYLEEDKIDTIFPFHSLAYNEYLKTTGIGLNLKLGIIYRFNQMVRLGIALHTPTGMALSDEYSSSLETQFDDGQGDGTAESPFGRFDYQLSTPWRFIGSLGLIFQKSGFLTAEIEWVDYSNASYNFTRDFDTYFYEEQEANSQIAQNLQNTMNIRLGGEYIISHFRLRAGLNLLGQPFLGDNNFDTAFSLGAGYRQDDFYLDLAYQRTSSNEAFTPYVLVDTSSQPTVLNNIIKTKILATFGFRF